MYLSIGPPCDSWHFIEVYPSRALVFEPGLVYSGMFGWSADYFLPEYLAVLRPPINQDAPAGLVGGEQLIALGATSFLTLPEGGIAALLYGDEFAVPAVAYATGPRLVADVYGRLAGGRQSAYNEEGSKQQLLHRGECFG